MLQSGCPPSAHGRVPPPFPVGLVGVFITKVEKSLVGNPNGPEWVHELTREMTNVSTAAAGRGALLSIGEEFSDVPIREDP